MCFLNSNTPCNNNMNCSICYEKSFESEFRSKNLSNKNHIQPWQIKKNSSKYFWFNCDKSKHEFKSRLDTITNGQWCSYPCCNIYGHLLCSDDSCKICFEASFASHSSSKYLSEKNELKSRQIKKQTNKKFIFKCLNSEHEWDASVSSIALLVSEIAKAYKAGKVAKV